MSRELHKAVEKLSDNVEQLTKVVGKLADNQSTALELSKPLFSQLEGMLKDIENNFPWPGAFNRGPLVRDSELEDEEKSLRGNEKSLDERVAELTQQRDHMADLVLDQKRQAAWDEEQRQDRADEFCQQQDDDLAQGLLWENTIK